MAWMAYRIGFYGLILAVALLGAIGLGIADRGSKRVATGQAAVVAAPLADNGGFDNGGDNGSGDNGGGDNGGFDNGSYDNGSYDNGSYDNGGGFDNDGASPTDTPRATATRTPTGSAPQPPPPPPPSTAQGPCQFVLGFADLHRILAGRDGNCLTNEFPDPNGTGDQLQLTSLPPPNGLMVWNRFTNSMRWTDGNTTTTYSKCLLQERLNTEVFAWELNPSLLVPESAPIPPGACDRTQRTAADTDTATGS
jgi:hypothetical protein